MSSPTRLPRVASLGLILAGLVFGLNSVTSSHETIWGYSLMGVTCLGLVDVLRTTPRPKATTVPSA